MSSKNLIKYFLVSVILSLLSLLCTSDPVISDDNPTIKTNQIVENGGRVSWYQGGDHSKVLFDRITNSNFVNTDVFIMEADGSDMKCITCNIDDITDRFSGQPVWHPDGIHCVIQVENQNSRHTRFEHVSFGINNDLWLINTRTLTSEKIFSTELNDAALHPQFNSSGDLLIFSRRIATEESFPALQGVTPGGENHWDGWQIQINDFDISMSGTNKISNTRLIKPNGNGFYETHSIKQDIVYSFTANGQGYVDDCYRVGIDGQNPINLTQSTKTWEEHATFSPSQKNFVFISSRHDQTWSFPQSDTRTINTELFMKNISSGNIEQLTKFNDSQDTYRVLTSDFDWNKEGNALIFLVAKIEKSNPLISNNEIWRIDFDEAK